MVKLILMLMSMVTVLVMLRTGTTMMAIYIVTASDGYPRVFLLRSIQIVLSRKMSFVNIPDGFWYFVNVSHPSGMLPLVTKIACRTTK